MTKAELQVHRNNATTHIKAKLFHFVELCLANKTEEAEQCLNDCQREIRIAQLLFGERSRRGGSKN